MGGDPPKVSSYNIISIMLSEELWKPYRRVNLFLFSNRTHTLEHDFRVMIQSSHRFSYSRHAVNDHDVSSSRHVNHNMHMHIRRMVSETVRKQHSKRVKRHRVWTITAQNTKTFQGFYRNFTIYLFRHQASACKRKRRRRVPEWHKFCLVQTAQRKRSGEEITRW